MIKGVSELEQEIVKKILSEYSNDFEFFYYGSRVKGGFSKVSDLDILIKGSKVFPSGDLEKLKQLFDCSKLPYIVNFADFQNIDREFFDSIKENMVSVF